MNSTAWSTRENSVKLYTTMGFKVIHHKIKFSDWHKVEIWNWRIRSIKFFSISKVYFLSSLEIYGDWKKMLKYQGKAIYCKELDIFCMWQVLYSSSNNLFWTSPLWLLSDRLTIYFAFSWKLKKRWQHQLCMQN